MFKRILVPTDGSPLSQEAVEHAIVFAKGTGARLVFFFAKHEFPPVYFGEGALIDPHAPLAYQEMASLQAGEILDAAENAANAVGVECARISSVSNFPYEAIIEAAMESDCDLIFMASHGRTGINSLLLGSETMKVLTHSSIPVLVHRRTPT